MIVFDNHVYCSQVSKKYRGSASVLEEKQEELKVQKDEIKLLRMTVESYDSKVNEQTDLINKLQKELTNVKGNRNWIERFSFGHFLLVNLLWNTLLILFLIRLYSNKSELTGCPLEFGKL